MLKLFRSREPEPTRLSVGHGEATFDVEVLRRASAKRVTLRVSSATGRVTLTLPERTRIATARTFLAAQAGWIAARMARLPDRRPFLPGSSLPLRGVEHRIVPATGARAATRVGSVEGEPALVVGGDPAGVPGRVRRFLQAEAVSDLRAAVARHAASLGVTVTRISLRDTRSRWGSCSSTGTLSFSWRLILAPPFVLDYLAAHEVAHRLEMNHSPRYWAVLRGLCPQTDVAEAWLKRHGSGLHRYG